ncbi:MAG TPA: hypothetical protein VFI84_02050 [Candidatus Saccharimonadales bacterium]|nr:hypothetical protein [Candidatus Saccharimonadales bacterium]
MGNKTVIKTGSGNAVLGLGFIGAIVYYLQVAHSFGAVILAILKAFVWPAFFVHDVLKFIG